MLALLSFDKEKLGNWSPVFQKCSADQTMQIFTEAG
jgi:hypothetical protein